MEWFAGVGFVAAPAVAVLASILQLLDVVAPVGVLHAPWIQISGIVVAIVGIFATVYAQLDMGDSWRIGVDPGETTTLVRTGVFGWVRNPIFTAMITFGFGIALVTPNLVAIAGFLLSGGHDRASGPHRRRAVSAAMHGDSYRDYLAHVGNIICSHTYCSRTPSVESDAARADSEDETTTRHLVERQRPLARASPDVGCSATRPACRARRDSSRPQLR